jgi:hypothetical protein
VSSAEQNSASSEYLHFHLLKALALLTGVEDVEYSVEGRERSHELDESIELEVGDQVANIGKHLAGLYNLVEFLGLSLDSALVHVVERVLELSPLLSDGSGD